MSDLYGRTHRQLQQRHGTQGLADRLEQLSHDAFEPQERAFIEAAAMFFLATVDERGHPTVSYKGGAPGFVRVVGPAELVFPSYDGNGMFLTLGNIAACAQVGLLFIDFERPHRLRVQGTAQLSDEPALLQAYPGAAHVVRVAASRVFVNCGRYIHPATTGALSPHVPDAQGQQPFPTWKRLDLVDGALPTPDARRVEALGGTIALEQYRGETEPPADSQDLQGGTT